MDMSAITLDFAGSLRGLAICGSVCIFVDDFRAFKDMTNERIGMGHLFYFPRTGVENVPELNDSAYRWWPLRDFRIAMLHDGATMRSSAEFGDRGLGEPFLSLY